MPGLANSQGQASSVRLVSNNVSIAAISQDDGDGYDSTAFWPLDMRANRYVLPVATQYVAVACVDNESPITIQVRSSSGTLLQSATCTSGASITPGKAYLCYSSNRTRFAAGSVVMATEPIFLIYEPSSTNDERNLMGVMDTDLDKLADAIDTDDDGDGVPDSGDLHPLNPERWRGTATDYDGDGIVDTVDTDDDDDGLTDSDEITCNSDPKSAFSRARDDDANGRADCAEAKGFDHHVAIRIGDYGSDGDKDLFVYHNHSHRVTVQPFVLENRGTANFTVRSGLSPQQVTTMKAWPASNLKFHVDDFDTDGLEDLIILKVKTAITGLEDPIIYADQSQNGQPRSTVLSMGMEKQQIAADALGYYYNGSSYFDSAALQLHSTTTPRLRIVYRTIPVLRWWNSSYLRFWGSGSGGSRYIGETEEVYDRSYCPSVCTFFSCRFVGGQWQVLTIAFEIFVYIDMSKFQTASKKYEQQGYSLSGGSNQNPSRAKSVLEEIFGTFNCWERDHDSTGTPGSDQDGESTLTDDEIINCIGIALATLAYPYRKDVELNDGKPASSNRIEIRVRTVNYTGIVSEPKLHASVHTPRTHYAAFPETISLNGNQGRLIKRQSLEPGDSSITSDIKFHTSSYALVEPVVDIPGLAWLPTVALATFNSNYNNNLTYCAYPELQLNVVRLSCHGYNSNSFARGLAEKVGTLKPLNLDYPAVTPTGTPYQQFISIEALDSNLMPGIKRLVPSEEFD